MRCVIRGRVQMVGFRAFAVASARRLGVCGWARNHPDGSVEVLAQGATDSVGRLLVMLGRGPAAASVTSIEETRVALAEQLADFQLVP